MLARILVSIINVYKLFLSPVLPPSCIFYPSCSAYFTEALTRYGAVKGMGIGMWRLLRCNPINRGGVDLLPLAGPLESGTKVNAPKRDS